MATQLNLNLILIYLPKKYFALQMELSVDSPKIQCVCHIRKCSKYRRSGSNIIIPLTDDTWQTLCKYVNAWKELDGIGHSIAIRFDPASAISQGYHQRCFSAFTSDCRLTRAKNKHKKASASVCNDLSSTTSTQEGSFYQHDIKVKFIYL